MQLDRDPQRRARRSEAQRSASRSTGCAIRDRRCQSTSFNAFRIGGPAAHGSSNAACASTGPRTLIRQSVDRRKNR
jgi:hypothetical protein